MAIAPQALFDALSPYVRFAHHFRTGGDFDISWRIIYDHLLLYTKEGYGWVTIDGARYRQAPGTLFLIRPGVLHGFTGDPGKDHLLMYNLHFDFMQDARSESLFPPWCHTPDARPFADDWIRPDPLDDPAFALPEHISAFTPAVYERLFFEILPAVSQGSLPAKLRVKAAMTELLAHLYAFRDQGTSQAPGRQAAIDGISQFLFERLAAPPTLDELAAHCGMSRAHFARCFSAVYGCSPMR